MGFHDRYLHHSWEAYQGLYLQPEGYVLDRERDGGTVTSEGQSYALLRAVWLRDAETFHRVFRWTEENLAREDGLFSWLWSPGDGGHVVDPNTATDADQDVAFALLLAAHAFQRPAYRERAREILEAIRRHTAVELPGGWYPSAGNWAVEERIVNLSYFVPYAYPYFHRAHPEGGWLEALDTGYRLLERTMAPEEVVLPPDFMRVDEAGAILPLPEGDRHVEDFSFDAIRVYWRVALDCLLHERPRACGDPVGTGIPEELWKRDGRLVTRYATDGTPLAEGESFSFYGALLPALRLHRPGVARSVLAQRLNPVTLTGMLELPERYYDLNWVWFGLAADRGLLQKQTPPSEEVVPE